MVDSKCHRLLEWGSSWWGIWYCQYARMCNKRGYPEKKLRLFNYVERMNRVRYKLRSGKVIYRHKYDAKYILDDIIGIGNAIDCLVHKSRSETGPPEDRIFEAIDELLEIWYERWNEFECRIVEVA